MPKKTFLVMIAVAVEAEDTDSGETEEIDVVQRTMIQAVHRALGDPPRPLGWQASWYGELDPDQANCGTCAECGSWVSDHDRPDPLAGLCPGAHVDGKLLCNEHLPRGHEWAM